MVRAKISINGCPKRSPFKEESILKRKEIVVTLLFLSSLISVLILGGCGSEVGTIRLAWDASTTNEDGSPLTDLKGYWIHYGTTPGAYAERTYTGNVTTYTLTGLTPGQIYYIAVTAVDTSDNESNLSNEVSGAAK